ncbi:unnamed protein product [Camellia sinensis]
MEYYQMDDSLLVLIGILKFVLLCFLRSLWMELMRYRVFALGIPIGSLSAQAKQLQPHEYNSGTFTLSNLGMFGVDRFDAIFPLGQGAIMAARASKPTAIIDQTQSAEAVLLFLFGENPLPVGQHGTLAFAPTPTGVASLLGKRSMSFSAIEVCDHETNGVEDDLSDDGSQAGEKKRRLNLEQVKTLEKNFELGNKLESERKMQLARALGLQPRQIAIWFQNRRARWKTKQLEKNYDVLKRQFDAIKADNDALQSQNQKLQAEEVQIYDAIHAAAFCLPSFAKK